MSDLDMNELQADIKALTEEVKAIRTLLEQFKILYELNQNESGK